MVLTKNWLAACSVVIVFFVFAGCRFFSQGQEDDTTQPFASYTESFEFGTDVFEGYPVDRDDPECTLERALPDLGENVKAWVYDSTRNQYVERSFDLSGVSGKGLKYGYIQNVIVNSSIHQVHKGCQFIGSDWISKGVNYYTCRQKRIEFDRPGEPLPLCRSGGYPKNSLENAAIAVVAALVMTGRFYSQVPGFEMTKPIEIILFPDHKRSLFVNNEWKSGTPSDNIVDNAYWTNLKRSPDMANASMIFLKSSTTSEMLWLHPTVVGHEFGHHFFLRVRS